MRNLPPELVDQVIDDVAATFDLKEVATCGLICRQYLPRSRKHLFAKIHLPEYPATFRRFMDLVDASSSPLLALVESLDMHLVDGAFAEAHMVRLHECHALRDLRICAPYYPPAEPDVFVQDLPFQHWLQTHIPHFASSLTHFELVMGSDIPLSLLADIICNLPILTHLRIDGDVGYGVFASDTVLVNHTFPRNLHGLDIAMHRGTNLFFEWLLSSDQPPSLTSFKLGGTVTTGLSTTPIEAYLKRVAPTLQSFSSSYWANGIRAYSDSQTSWCIFPSIDSTQIVRPISSVPARGDWPAIDSLLATPQYASLERLLLTDEVSRASIATEEMRALMPQANARGILDQSQYCLVAA
ncbi:hypothetical protein DFH06DRAFT_1479546 [Mycena polygramma]|nr:hypothetical protein DFH06DRAFT_1479546 [Mycena polygramma]